MEHLRIWSTSVHCTSTTDLEISHQECTTKPAIIIWTLQLFTFQQPLKMMLPLCFFYFPPGIKRQWRIPAKERIIWGVMWLAAEIVSIQVSSGCIDLPGVVHIVVLGANGYAPINRFSHEIGNKDGSKPNPHVLKHIMEVQRFFEVPPLSKVNASSVSMK